MSGNATMSPANEPFAPRTLGRYTLAQLIARGGMSSVYLARLSASEGFTKWLALKTLDSDQADEPGFVQMFLNEARLAARIDHPNVCTVFDFGEVDGRHFLVMEYLHGAPFHAVMARAWEADRLPWSIAARIVADAAKGLHAAHELRMADGRSAEVVHRDVSPQNLFVLFNGTSKVVDFGIAKSNVHLGDKTQTGVVKGKVAYMSPEQLTRQPVDRRADIWSLGVVLWEASTGERLFRRETPYATAEAVVRAPIAAPSEREPACPAALDRIVLRALQREVAERYATAAELARDLEVLIAREAEPVTTEDVARRMHSLFATEERDQQRMLGLGGTADAADVTRTATIDMPHVVSQPTPTVDPAIVTRATQSGATRADRSRVWTTTFALLALAVAAFAVGLRAFRPGDSARDRVERAAPDNRASSDRTSDVAGSATTRGSPPTTTRPIAREAVQEATTSATGATTNPLALVPAARDASLAGTSSSANRASSMHSNEASVARSMGTISIIAFPSARAFVDGRPLGDTPVIRRALAVGNHELRLVPSDGRAPHVSRVRVESGADTRVSHRF